MISSKQFAVFLGVCDSKWDEYIKQGYENKHGEYHAPIVTADAIGATAAAVTITPELIAWGISSQNEHRQLFKIIDDIMVTTILIELDLLGTIFENDICNVAYDAILGFDGQDFNILYIVDSLRPVHLPAKAVHTVGNFDLVAAFAYVNLGFNGVIEEAIHENRYKDRYTYAHECPCNNRALNLRK